MTKASYQPPGGINLAAFFLLWLQCTPVFVLPPGIASAEVRCALSNAVIAARYKSHCAPFCLHLQTKFVCTIAPFLSALDLPQPRASKIADKCCPNCRQSWAKLQTNLGKIADKTGQTPQTNLVCICRQPHVQICRHTLSSARKNSCRQSLSILELALVVWLLVHMRPPLRKVVYQRPVLVLTAPARAAGT